MRLLIDARSLGEKPSGIGIYIYTNCIYMMKIKGAQIALVTDICESKEMNELEKENILIYKLGYKINKNFSLFKYYSYVQSCIDDYKPDVFWEANQISLKKLKNPYGILATTVHDVFPITHSNYFGLVYSYYFKYGLRKTLKNFDLIVYNSKETKYQCEKFFEEAKEKKNHIGYTIVRKPEHKEINSNNSFLYIGNLENRKGTDILLEAFDKYIQAGGKNCLRLGGKVRDDNVQKKLSELLVKYPEQIIYLGYISEEQKDEEYASCKTFVFPSMAEGFGVPIIEAMSFHKKIIASNLSIFEEIVGDNIELIDIADDSKSFYEKINVLCDAMLKDCDEHDIDIIAYNKVVDYYTDGHFASEIYNFFELGVLDEQNS